MIRNALGSLLGLIGAAAAVWSPFRAWYGYRQGRDYRIEELFSGAGITDDRASLFGSILLPFLFAALLTLVAVVLRSRLLMGLAGVVVLGFAVLWMVRQGQAAGSLSVGGDGQGLGDGLANAFGGGALLLLGAAVMSGRPSRRRRTDAPAAPDEAPYGTPYPPAHQDPAPYAQAPQDPPRAYPPTHQDPGEAHPPEPSGPSGPSGPTGPTGWGPRPPRDQQP
ncbi:hypothetical protein [Streptomyces sp. H27-S2]|uniref:hypothetical protein n=1 Tax=Streptomyces antarcticus TaxID=2996458 RepID=UPI002271B082|nr:hypothetical protein [Streptomyces sp. H27-S2]MCY0954996.1 hypothetical protein [Streptomyces sp. H27-S2]